MSTLRNKLIRLAYEKPHVRSHVLPILSSEDSKRGHEIPTTGLRDYGTWFVKTVSVTPLSPHSAMVHLVLESTKTSEVREISKQLDQVPGTAVKFDVFNLGGRGAEVQGCVVSAILGQGNAEVSSMARMKLIVDPVRGDWDKSVVNQWEW